MNNTCDTRLTNNAICLVHQSKVDSANEELERKIRRINLYIHTHIIKFKV